MVSWLGLLESKLRYNLLKVFIPSLNKFLLIGFYQTSNLAFLIIHRFEEAKSMVRETIFSTNPADLSPLIVH